MFRSHKPGEERSGEDPGGRETGQGRGDQPGDADPGQLGEKRPPGGRRARRIIPMERGGRGSRGGQDRGRRTRPEPEFRWSDIFAMVVAGLQVILPYFFIILAAIVVTYLLVAAFFGM
jgi:hypothetical protein